jgi:competence ComEA-like helix-hairpin-helix protein
MRALFMLLAIVAVVASGSIPAAAQKATTAPASKPAAGSRPAKAVATATAPVNINTATQAQLESLPGVGAKAAERILEYRQKTGSFKKVEEILESSRSCPFLLMISRLSAHRSVARNRQKSQQISQHLAGGGRFGGRTWSSSGAASTALHAASSILASGPRGLRFESSRPDHFNQTLSKTFGRGRE